MQHQRTNRKLGMKSPHRRAMLRNLATSLVVHERIRTTDTRAKEVRRVVERMITLGKRDDLNARRQAAKFIRGNTAVAKLFELGQRYKERPGGYTRIVRIGRRHGDNAPIVIIELVEAEMPKRAPKKKKKAEKKPAEPKAAAPAEEAATEAPQESSEETPAEGAAEEGKAEETAEDQSGEKKEE